MSLHKPCPVPCCQGRPHGWTDMSLADTGVAELSWNEVRKGRGAGREQNSVAWSAGQKPGSPTRAGEVCWASLGLSGRTDLVCFWQVKGPALRCVGKRRRQRVSVAGRWKSPGRCGPVGTGWNSYSLLRPRRAPGGVEGPGLCAPVAWSAALPAFCLLLPSKASFLSNPPFWGVGICFNPTSPLARLYRPRAQTAPLGFLARGDQGPSKGQRRAQRRRLFSSSPRRISQAREVGPAYRGAVTKKGLSLAGALGGARCSRVTRGSARASSNVEPADCRAARPRAPPPATHKHTRAPSLPQNDGGRRETAGSFEVRAWRPSHH
nr:uncharacterized protein LOC129488717 [Symphalangus syndactylus]